MKILTLSIFFMAAAFSRGFLLSETEDEKISEIILRHFERYPKMEKEDLYKLLHHAAMGSEHAVKNEEFVRNWMEKELAGLDTNFISNDPLVDTISANGRIARVHLRPYIKNSGDIENLLRAFIKTANSYQGSKETLQKYLDVALQLSEGGKIPLDRIALQTYFNSLELKNFPAVHHSKNFSDAYLPAYRVVDLKIFTIK